MGRWDKRGGGGKEDGREVGELWCERESDGLGRGVASEGEAGRDILSGGEREREKARVVVEGRI